MVCRSCRFYDVLRTECRRHAPTVVVDDAGRLTAWPRPKPDDWCGEYLEAAR